MVQYCLLDNQWYRHDGYQVEVVNTVRAGDSFLANLIHRLLNDDDPKKQLILLVSSGA